ncbi:MAG TPA: hypothetical protein VGO40_17305 [Longimicrobium sp.]|jgi:hypothetical protein|nr:hypothetical protein [Longimicrobium sp.]
MTAIPILDAHQLRELADAASSMRKPGGEPIYGVVTDPTSLSPKLAIVPGDGTVVPEGALFEIDTHEVEKRPTATAVIIDSDGVTKDLAEDYDAVFWSEASVEKFVFPYYASKSLWDAAFVLDTLSTYWYGKVPVPEELTGLAGEVGAPFALAHTPDSDWNTLSLGSDLHLLIKGEQGVQKVSLADLLSHARRRA